MVSGTDIRWLVLAAGSLRCLLLAYGIWHDSVLHLPYTDVDYHVFTDAAKYVAANESPYKCEPYRYTPLIAYLMLAAVHIHSCIGKLIFITSDVLGGLLVYQLSASTQAALIYLFNPLLIIISTRGNCDSIVSTLILLVLYSIKCRRYFLAGLLYGVAVHLRIYPIIYALPLCLLLQNKESRPVLEFSSRRLWFFFGSLVSFGLLAAYFYDLYGEEFITHTYLYHLTRSDVKHNFSIYFYMLYLSFDVQGAMKPALALVTFLPQIITQLLVSLKCYRDVTLCLFLQTVLFVIYNKVYTAQYFIWFITFLPFIVSRIRREVISPQKLYGYIVIWTISLMLWLTFAYMLEFHAVNTFILIWLSSLVFHVVNVVGCVCCINSIRPEVFI